MTTRLSASSFEKARAFLLTQARPLERELFRFHFENGTPADVLTELSKFQNEDGGFGHGLEADVRLPDSSAICTSIAFQVFRQLSVSADHPMVQRAVSYLLSSFDQEAKIWWQVSPRVNDFPHAPWWHWKEESANPENYLANTRAEMAGYLNDHASLVPPKFVTSLNAAVSEALQNSPETLEMHDLLCYLRFAETKSLPEEIKSPAAAKLLRIAPSHVPDPETWNGYCLKPLDLAPSPNSLLHSSMAELVSVHLAWELDRQGEDGAWAPAWSWAEFYPEAWALAEREWKGVLTLKFLLSAKAYGALDLR